MSAPLTETVVVMAVGLKSVLTLHMLLGSGHADWPSLRTHARMYKAEVSTGSLHLQRVCSTGKNKVIATNGPKADEQRPLTRFAARHRLRCGRAHCMKAHTQSNELARLPAAHGRFLYQPLAILQIACSMVPCQDFGAGSRRVCLRYAGSPGSIARHDSDDVTKALQEQERFCRGASTTCSPTQQHPLLAEFATD